MEKRLIVFISLGLFFCGCEQNPYQMVKGEDGETYRLNRKTGELAVIRDDKIVLLETPEVRALLMLQQQKYSEPIEWPVTGVPGKELKFRIETSSSVYF